MEIFQHTSMAVQGRTQVVRDLTDQRLLARLRWSAINKHRKNAQCISQTSGHLGLLAYLHKRAQRKLDTVFAPEIGEAPSQRG